MTPLETLNLAMARKPLGCAKDHATIAAGERMQRRALEAPSANVIAQLEKAQADVLAEREIREAREDYNARRVADRLDRIEEQGDGTAFADRTTPVDC